MSTELSPADLDRFAATYYLNAAIEDVDIEELAQQHSIPMIVEALGDVERVLEMGYGTGLITRELLATKTLNAGGRIVANTNMIKGFGTAAVNGLTSSADNYTT